MSITLHHVHPNGRPCPSSAICLHPPPPPIALQEPIVAHRRPSCSPPSLPAVFLPQNQIPELILRRYFRLTFSLPRQRAHHSAKPAREHGTRTLPLPLPPTVHAQADHETTYCAFSRGLNSS